MLNKNYIFFRDDDVYKLDKNFIDFFNLFLNNKIPIVYGVIPGKAEDKLLKFLLLKKNQYPRLIDIAQHGWLHKNYNSEGTDYKYEFGIKRTYQEQKKDIICGWLKLYGSFREKFSSIFIPPFHAYDFNTLKIINEMGERKNLYIFSAGKKTIPKIKNFLDIPAKVNFDSTNIQDKKYLWILLEKIRENSMRDIITGVLLHHETFNAKGFLILKDFLKLVKKGWKNNFILLSNLIKKRKVNKFDITFELTNKCNLRCKICNIWKKNKVTNLRYEDIVKVFELLLKTYSIGSVSLTGGEPFLNPELEKIFHYLCELKASRKIESIGIYSNGFAKKRILNFLRKNSGLVKNLDFGISVDGLKQIHNILRGSPYAFKNTTYLIKKIKSNFSQVKLAVKFTINALNFRELEKVYKFCKSNEVFFLPKFAEVNNKFYYHRIKNPAVLNYMLTSKNRTFVRKILIKIYKKEKEVKKKTVNLIFINQLITFSKHNYKTRNECYTPLYSLFFNHKGDIHPCLYMPALTNINNKDWIKKILLGDHLEYVYKGIDGTCPKCFAYHGFLKNVNLPYQL